MAAKKIGDNTGSQDSLLKSVKADKGTIKLEAGLKTNEEKLASSILNCIFQKSDTDNEYLLNLTSKNVDAVLGRIETYLEKDYKKLTQTELENVKTAIENAINNAIDNEKQISNIASLLQKITDKIDQLEKLITKDVKQTLVQFISNCNNTDDALANVQNDASVLTQIDKKTTLLVDNTIKMNDHMIAFSQYVGMQLDLLDSNITALSNALAVYSSNIIQCINSTKDMILNATSGLKPTSKDEKKGKAFKNQIDSICNVLKSVMKPINAINEIVTNFIGYMVKGFKTFLDCIFNVVIAFVLKLFGSTIFPIVIMLGVALYLLAEPLKKLLEPIIGFLKPLLDRICSVVDKIIDFITKTAWPFILSQLTWLKNDIIIPIWDSCIKPLLEGIKPYAKRIGEGIAQFVINVVDTEANIMKGIGTKGEEIGKAIADVVIGLAGLIAELTNFFTKVVKILGDFLDGFGSKAKEIGVAVGVFVLTVVTIVAKLVKFIEDIVDIIINLVEPLKEPAKKLGQLIAKSLMFVLNLADTVLTGIQKTWKWIKNKMADVVIVRWKPFEFLKGSSGGAGSDEMDDSESEEAPWKKQLSDFLQLVLSGKFADEISSKVTAAQQALASFIFDHPFVKHLSQVIELTSQFILANLAQFVNKFSDLIDDIISGKLFDNLFNSVAKHIGKIIKKAKKALIEIVSFIFDHPFIKHLSQVIELTSQFILANLAQFVNKFSDLIDDIISGKLFTTILDSIFNNKGLQKFVENTKKFINDLIQPFIEPIKNVSKAIEDAIERISKSICSAIDELSGALEDIGDEIEDAIERISKSICSAIDDISKSIQTVINNIAQLVTDIKDPIIKAIDDISASIQKILDSVNDLVKEIKEHVVKAIDDISASIQSILNSVNDLVKEIKEHVVKAIDDISASIQTVINNIAQLVTDIKDPIINAINAIKDAIVKNIDKTGNSIEKITNEIIVTIRDIKTELVAGIKKIVDGILNLPEKAVGLIVKAIKGILNVGKAIGNAVGGAFNKVKGWFGKDKKEEKPKVQLTENEIALKDSILEKISPITQLIQDLITNITGFFDKILPISDIVSSIATTITSITGTISSISSIVAGITSNVVQSLSQSITSLAGTLATTAAQIVANITSSITNIAKTLATTAAQIVTDVTASVISGVNNAIQLVLTGLVNITNIIANMPVEIEKGLSTVISGITGIVGDLGKGVFNTVNDAVTDITNGIANLFKFDDKDEKKITETAIANISSNLKPIENINKSQNAFANGVENTESEKALSQKAFDKRIDGIYVLLKQLTDSMQGGFEDMANKLNSNATPIPIPININTSNIAAMENNI